MSSIIFLPRLKRRKIGHTPHMKKLLASLAALLLGGGLYGLCELLFRGWTHWSMLLAGGVSLLLILLGSGAGPLWQKWVLGCALITAVEFLSGCILNLGLGWGIWDYSAHPLNLMGQICPLFCLFWLLLSIPAVALCRYLRRLAQWDRDQASTAARTWPEK